MAFNQPLSFDTAKVTSMDSMFYVRFPRPTLASGPPTSAAVLHALLLTRGKNAEAFNQPLNFNTSRLTNMKDMFRVRSSHVPGPGPLVHRLSPLHTRRLARRLLHHVGRTRRSSTRC